MRAPMRLTPLLTLIACLSLAGTAAAKPSEHPFEIVPGSFSFVPSSFQAGAHADWVTSFDFAHEANGTTFNDARTLINELPAGFDASDTAVPTCTDAQLVVANLSAAGVPDCPIASQVGQVSIELFAASTNVERVTVPVYNMEVTSFGVAAELGFRTAFFTQVVPIAVRGGDTGLTAETLNIVKAGEPHNVTFTVWGMPAASEHDAQRGELCGELGGGCHNAFGAPQPAGIPVKPFLSNPTSCGLYEARMRADSWEEASPGVQASFRGGPITGCDRVQFDPSIEVQPSTRSAESPTGLEVSLIVPQTWDNQFTIATANLKDVKVTLPLGMTANPSLAAGLGACSRAQFAAESSSSPPGAGCPDESKIGSIRIDTPLLSEPIEGAVYIATPYENKPEFGDPEHPGGSLLALYVVAKEPQRGILIKVAGKITPDPVTGQLVTTFSENPQQPFSRFTLKFRPGATAPLASPPTCGIHTTEAALTPWSAPEEPRLLSSSFEVTQGVHEGPCPSGGIPPFKPRVVTGTQNNAGGSYSPYYLRIMREDGEQELTRFSTILPPGLTGNLTGIPFCPDAAIEAAARPTRTGSQELAEPSCPAASQVGHTTVGAGVGPVLAQNPGRLYLAGPYHGAPLSLVSITSAVVGPFDLGTVVIRFALDINPTTAQVEVSAAGSDPIPHIIRGIVVHVRDIRVYIDREHFMINPTNCSPLQISNTIDGDGADPANPADQVPVTVTSPFEAADCSSLGFKPVFKVSTAGTTSRTKGASLSVKLTVAGAPGIQSNIRSVKVDLPKQLPSRLTTLQKACPDATFNANPAACSAASRVGTATAITPILPVPLTGPAYFVSHGGAKFPELIVVIQGYGFTIELHGETFISKQGITSSTFHTIPDQPVTSFELTLPQGPGSALAANGNLCGITKTVLVKRKVKVRSKGRTRTITRKVHKTVAGSLVMPTAFVAQNGAVIHQSTPITVTGCAKKRSKAKAKSKTKKKK